MSLSVEKLPFSVAFFKIVVAAMDFSSPYGHINYKKKFGTFVKNVTKSPLFPLSHPTTYIHLRQQTLKFFPQSVEEVG